MNPEIRRPKEILKEEALIVAYAMSRLDRAFLDLIGVISWKQAFDVVGNQLAVRPSSIKNLMQEFDPLHPNTRSGWWRRDIRPSRRAVHEELVGISDAAVANLALKLLGRSVTPPKDSAAVANERVGHVVHRLQDAGRAAEAAAARLQTGRQAEDYFWQRSAEIVGVANSQIVDLRDHLLGFDYRLKGDRPWLVEVKGLREKSGRLLFTNLEWQVAARTGQDYALVVVSNLAKSPRWHLVHNPVNHLKAKRRDEKRLTTSWEAHFSAAS